MDIWLHTHTVTTTDIFPDLGEELAAILGDVRVQTMPLCYGWGCITFQTASQMCFIHIQCVWAPSFVVDGHMAAHSHHYHHRRFPGFRRVGWNHRWCSVQTMPLHYGWGCRTFQTASHIHEIHIQGVWVWLHTHTITTTDISPDLGELAAIIGDVSAQTMPLHYGWGCRTFQTASQMSFIHIQGFWKPPSVVDGFPQI